MKNHKMKINLFIASVLVSQTFGFRMLRRANEWKERGLTGMERLNQIRLQREGKALIVHFQLKEKRFTLHDVCLSVYLNFFVLTGCVKYLPIFF